MQFETYHSQHAPAFFDGTATSEESNQKNEDSDTDEDDRGVPNESTTFLEGREHLDVTADVVVYEHPYSKTQ